MPTTYHGSCHCRAIRFEADLDLASGTYRCNCSYCRKTRNWIAMTSPKNVRVTAGADHIATYKVTADSQNDYQFCRTCGVRLWTKGTHEALGGDFLNLMVSTLDDVPPDTLIAAPMMWGDGANDQWMNPPEETRHL